MIITADVIIEVIIVDVATGDIIIDAAGDIAA